MRYLAVLLTLVAFRGAAADIADRSQLRDGAWLQNGIRHYQQFDSRKDAPAKEATDARLVVSYVCAVVDLEKYLVLRADLLARALEDGRKKRRYISTEKLDGMAAAVPILVPLMEGKSFAVGPSCGSALVIVRDYLNKYPRELGKGAAEIIDSALLDAYRSDAAP